jgi:formate dehydrogenase subunit gamma
MPRYPTWNAERAIAIIAEFRDVPGALLPVLHALMAEFGHISPATLSLLAVGLNVSRADVQGVLSFYHEFRTTPPGRHVIKLCRAEACQSMGAATLESHAKRSLAVDWGQTTADGAFTLEPVFCLGNCALSPAVMIDEQLYGRVDPGKFEAILTEVADSAPAAEQAP